MDVPSIESYFSREKSTQYSLVPKEFTQNRAIFYGSIINRIELDNLERIIHRKIDVLEVSNEELIQIRQHYYKDNRSEFTHLISDINKNYKGDVKKELLSEYSSSPIVKLFDKIINYGISNFCSDIHFEGTSKGFRIRVRKEGVLKELLILDSSLHSLFISRLKIISNLDIAEKRLPQDGRFTFDYNDRPVNIRVAITPTVQGEKAVLRILDQSSIEYSLEGIGLKGDNLSKIKVLMSQPHGLLLICGPTNSGKTSTIYAMLKEINNPDINIITIEDPVEYKLEGINQIQVNDKTGLDFEKGLKSILRSDPDIVMIGEIRNTETAKTAIRASITGHSVISTLHTNDSPAAVVRLMDMGVEDYLVAAGLIGVISQRLIRILCPHCKREVEKQDYLFKGTSNIFEKVGCEKCNDGYLGRKAIFEILIFDEELKEHIREKSSLKDLREKSISKGMSTLKDEVTKMVLKGETTLEEAYKVISTV